MTQALMERTILPPEDDSSEMARFLRRIAALREAGRQARLVLDDGEEVELPGELRRAVVDICYILSINVSVEFIPHHTVLTTQEAADLLHISRPTLVKLLDEGEIPHFKRGRHRRVHLSDVLAYDQREQRARDEALDQMVHEAEEAGLYDTFTTPKPTR